MLIPNSQLKSVLSVVLSVATSPVFAQVESPVDIGYSAPSLEEVSNWFESEGGKLTQVKLGESSSELPLPDMGGTVLHPQGMYLYNGKLILSSVDKDAAKGFVHAFRINSELKKLELVEAIEDLSVSDAGEEMSKYHPGGIDMDRSTGRLIVPLAQYKKLSTTLFLNIDPARLEDCARGARLKDHIGTVICAEQAGEACVLGFNWDAKSCYKMQSAAILGGETLETAAREHVIAAEVHSAYQDCKYLSTDAEDSVYALCTATKPSYSIVLVKYTAAGNMEIVHNVVAPAVGGFFWKWTQKSMAQNPMAFERVETDDGGYKIRFYFVPHDGAAARLFVYETPDMKL